MRVHLQAFAVMSNICGSHYLALLIEIKVKNIFSEARVACGKHFQPSLIFVLGARSLYLKLRVS
jgi:hypothetical protein